MAQGYLQVDVVSDANSFPVQDADIVVARTEEPDEIIEETRTNSSGQTENLPLDAPPLELSLSPEETERPYAEYTIRITAPGFEPFVVSGTEVLADVTAIQGIRLRPLSNVPAGEQTEIVKIPEAPGLKIPHIGWNSLDFPHEGRLFAGLKEQPYVYFVHSYYLKAKDPSIVKATTEYGVTIHASVEKGNLFACQFHPEKSSTVGLQILKNFAEI